jgi:hypothetical protein
MLTVRLAPILGKLGTRISGTSCILHNSRESTTMALYLNVLFYIKFIVIYITNSASCRIFGLFAVRNVFILFRIIEIKSGQSGKNIRTVGNPTAEADKLLCMLGAERNATARFIGR